MNLLEKFLNTDLTISNNELIDLFNQVVEEIRTEELGVSKDYFLKFGDSEALDIINKNSIQGLCLHTDNLPLHDDIPSHVNELLTTYEKNQSVTVFRGTRLPISDGTFNNGFIHTTPHLATSIAYSTGISNGFGGIGRRLNKINENIGLGFIHSFDASLDEKIYKNFQFEKFISGIECDSNIHLKDLFNELKKFSNLPKDSFQIEYVDGKNMYGHNHNFAKMSENMKLWFDFISSRNCMETPFYEVMLDNSSTPKHTFLINSQLKPIKINMDNKKMKLVIDKLQSLLIQDFYQILPLDKLVEKISFDTPDTKIIPDKKLPTELINLLISQEKELKNLMNIVQDFIQISQKTKINHEEIQSLMCNSKMIGATNMIGDLMDSSNIQYSDELNAFLSKIHHQKLEIEKPVNDYLNNNPLSLNIDLNNLVTQVIDKIKEKQIPLDLTLKEFDKNGVMLNTFEFVEKKFNLDKNFNPTISDYISTLEKLNLEEKLRLTMGKKSLVDLISPMLQYSYDLNIKNYKPPTFINDCEKIKLSMIKIRNKLVDNNNQNNQFKL